MASGRPTLDTTYINSVCVDDYAILVDGKKWKTGSTEGNFPIKTATIYLAKSVESVLVMSDALNGKSVTIQRGTATSTDEYIFRGEVINVTSNGSLYTITCADKLSKSQKKSVTTSFDKDIDTEAGKYSEIFKTLISYVPELSTDSSSVSDSGTTFLLTKFICRGSSAYERSKALIDALGWQGGYDDNNDKIFAHPKGYVNQTTTIETGVNIVQTPKWDIDSTKLFNLVDLRGATQEVQTTEIGQIGTTAGYTTTAVLLNNTPISTKVYVDASNPPTTLKTGGISDSTSVFDYSVDNDTNQIKWNTSHFTPTSGHYCKTDYSYLIPVPIIVRDNSSISKYSADPLNPIPKEKQITRTDIQNVSDAEKYATEYLNAHKEANYIATIFVTDVKDLSPNQRVYINDTANGISGYFYVISVSKSAPYRYDEIKVQSQILSDDNYTFDQEQRTKRLEEEQLGDTDLLNQVFSTERTISYKRRYASLYVQDMNGNSQYDTLAKFDAGYKYDVTTTPVISRLVPGNNEFEEYIYDTEFYDSANSSGITWDTSAKTITIANSGILLTNAIALGHAYANFTVEFGSLSSSSVTIQISGDNKSTWQTVTKNMKTAFTSSDGTGIYLKITNSTGSSVTIQNSYDSNNEYTAPGIKIILED